MYYCQKMFPSFLRIRTRRKHLDTWHKTLLSTLYIVLLISGVYCDFCQELNQNGSGSSLRSKFHWSSIPKGGLYAGNFTKASRETSLNLCIMACCQKAMCNVVFFFNSTCYLIECNTTHPHACDPIQNHDRKFNSSLMISIRTLEETKALRSTSPPVTNIQSVTKPSESSESVALKPCEYGISNNCPKNETCVIPENSKSKQGKCQCKEGFQRDAQHICNILNLAVSNTTAPAQNRSQTLPPSTTSSKMVETVASTTRFTNISSSSVQPSEMVKLIVSAGENKVVRIPENEVTLSAFVLPKAKGEKYNYKWSLIAYPDGAETGSMISQNTDTLTMKAMIPGFYTLSLNVSGTNKFGQAFVNVTVLPPARENKPPVAIIKPTHLELKLPKSAILDGSDSTDDDKIVSYYWEEVSGPINRKHISGSTAMLTLSKLDPGEYLFKLTVTDSDGAANFTFSNVTVIKEIDYPPRAVASSDQLITLPQNSVTLYGNASTDDKGITSYEWMKSADDKLTADMMGVRTAILKLSNLEEGDYKFTLKVTDGAGQADSTAVHVFVKPEQNQPPHAVTASHLTIFLPQAGLVLDGGNSTDDKDIVRYEWKQVIGPSTLTIKNGNKALATATGAISVGVYQYKLTVYDAQGLKSSSSLSITVKQDENHPPVADAGGDKVLKLPLVLVTVDGSRSTDDRGIVKYEWTRDTKSLAAGDVVNGTNYQAVLQLANLVAGQYIFTLKVTDAEGLSSTDSASIIVQEDSNRKNLLMVQLDTDIRHFTEENKKNLESQLSLLLHRSSPSGNTVVKMQKLREDPSSGCLNFYYHVYTVAKDFKQIRNGVESLRQLKRRLSSEPDILEFTVLTMDTVVCQNNCSNHGHCDPQTKQCVCEAFWMQNIFKQYFSGESNCEWSILYVVVISFFLLVTVAGIIWSIICCCKKRRWKYRKRTKYSLLPQADNKKDELVMLTTAKLKSPGIMSETDLTSDEETLFVNNKKTNGSLIKPLNGLSHQYFKTKMKT